MQTALDTNEPVIHGDVVIEIEGKTHPLTVIIEPISDGTEDGVCVVAFREEGLSTDGPAPSAASGAKTAEVRAAEHELRTTRAQLQATIDELETANEEMRSATEEYHYNTDLIKC